RRPQSPLQADVGKFRTEGWQPLGLWMASGKFEYARRAERGVNWSGVADAYAGTPYIWADTVGGDWSADETKLAASVGTPEWLEKIAFGAEVNYAVSQGSRQNDPRPFYRRRDVGVAPAVTIRLAAAHRIGSSVMLGWTQEDGEMGYFTTATDFILYRLRGLSTFDRGATNSSDRRTTGRSLVWSAQYSGNSDSGDSDGREVRGDRSRVAMWQWAVSGNLSAERADTYDGISIPQFAGRFVRNGFGATARVRYAEPASSAAGNHIEMSLAFKETDGRGAEDFSSDMQSTLEPDFLATNVIDKSRQVSARLEWWQANSKGESSKVQSPLWVSGEIIFVDLSRKDIVGETAWQATTTSAALRISSSLGTSSGTGQAWGVPIFLSAYVGTTVPVQSGYEEAMPTRFSDILVRPDLAVNAARQVRAGIMLAAEVPLAVAGLSLMRIVVNTDIAHSSDRFADGSAIGQRTAAGIRLEVIY
ncbi:MAG: hypothetical protein IAF08_11295, partial [Rhizobacter sp.]|nr:hypothetical protein [Chlorobiales bacterium]